MSFLLDTNVISEWVKQSPDPGVIAWLADVDEDRVFVAGTSSGAIFSNLLACRYGDQLLATAPVAGSLPESENCRGTPATMLIHGIDDPHVPFAEGEAARDFYLERNGCSGEAEPAVASKSGILGCG